MTLDLRLRAIPQGIQSFQNLEIIHGFVFGGEYRSDFFSIEP
jgi:hypothetical protein